MYIHAPRHAQPDITNVIGSAYPSTLIERGRGWESSRHAVPAHAQATSQSPSTSHLPTTPSPSWI
jgi:hypothetical protein